MFYKIRYLTPKDNYKLIVEFINGVTKEYDMKKIMEKFPVFNLLLKDKELYYNAYVDTGGYGVVWNEDIDISCNELWTNGKVLKTKFDGLISFSDASKLWGLNESTLRKAVSYGKLHSGLDTTKFGHQWIVTYDAMIREYGEPKL